MPVAECNVSDVADVTLRIDKLPNSIRADETAPTMWIFVVTVADGDHVMWHTHLADRQTIVRSMVTMCPQPRLRLYLSTAPGSPNVVPVTHPMQAALDAYFAGLPSDPVGSGIAAEFDDPLGVRGSFRAIEMSRLAA